MTATGLNARWTRMMIGFDQGMGRLSSLYRGGPPCSMLIMFAFTPGTKLAQDESSV